MANGRHLEKSIKRPYTRNGLTDRREIWHADDYGPVNFTLLTHTLHLPFYEVNCKNIKNKE